MRPATVAYGAAVVLAGLVLLTAACGAPDRASLATFAGGWSGHDRGLSITKSGAGSEEWLSSCCHVVIEMKFQLSNPRGTSRSAAATATVTFVRVRDRTWFTKADPPPHVGQTATLVLRDSVLTEPLVGASYCGPDAKAASDGLSPCGA